MTTLLLKKLKLFNGEIFENDEEVVTKYFSGTDEEIDPVEIKNLKINEKSISSKTREQNPPKKLPSDLKLSITTVQGKKCNICDYSCFAKSTMNRHMESVHEGKKTFKCDICD